MNEKNKTNPRCKNLILIAATLIFMATNADGPSFDLTIPTITQDFHANVFSTQIMANIAQLCVAAFVLAAGTFGDLFGRRKWLLIGTMGLLLGYLLQSLSMNVPMIIAARMLVGISTALTTALSLAIVIQTFTGKESAAAIGIFAGAGSFSGAVIPIISQFFNQSFGWRFSFVVPILLSCAGFWMVWKYFTESSDPAPRKLDIVGILLNAVGITSIVYGFILVGSLGWSSSSQFWLAAGAIWIALFIWWENHTPDPALKLSLFKRPAFAIAVAMGLIFNLVDFGLHPILSIFLQSIQDRTPFFTSVILLPWALGAAFIAPFAGRWALSRSARSLMTIGFVISSISILGTVLLTVDSPAWLAPAFLLPFAMGYGLANIPRTDLLMASVPAEESGMASAANSMGIETGTALGIAVFNSIIAGYALGDYRTRLQTAGLSTENVKKGVEVLKSAIEGTVATRFPAIPANIISQLVEGFKESYTLAIGKSFTIGAILLAICAAVIWFGLRDKKEIHS